MKLYNIRLTVATLAAVLISVSQCKDTLHITADSVLREVCVNGEPERLFNPGKVKELDHLTLPEGWNDDGKGCITVYASHSNHESKPGIFGCISSDTAPSGYVWQCVSKKGLGDCCKSCRYNDWKNPLSYKLLRYPSTDKWNNREFLASLTKQCGNAQGKLRWRWDNRSGRHQVCCRIRACIDRCSQCKIDGPGTCDPGMCLYGPTEIQDAPPARICNYRCCVEATTSMNSNEPPTITLTNKATMAVTTKHCKLPYCLAIVDIEKCNIKNYFEYTDSIEVEMEINKQAVLPENTNLPYVQLASESSKPWITIQGLEGNAIPGHIRYNPDIHDSYRRVSVCFTGYNGGVLQTSDTVRILHP